MLFLVSPEFSLFLIHLWRFKYSCPVCIVALFTFHLLVPHVIKAYCLPPCFFLLFLFFQTDPPTAALVFAHVCRVMTFVPADCTDQLFVLCLDFVSRPLVSCTSERLRKAINSLSSEVYKAALIQKLSQNMWILQLQVKSRGQVDLSARLGHWISGQQTTTLSQESYTQLWDCVYHVSLVTVSRLQCDGLRYFPMFRSNFNVFDLSVVQKLPLFYIKMMSINRGLARIFQRGGYRSYSPRFSLVYQRAQSYYRGMKARLDYQPLFGKMSPDPGDGGNRAYMKAHIN